jgi:8-oxo-dGTP diphosphatase
MSVIRLAGGILWRELPEGLRLAVIHRPRQGDWSLPKGRVDPKESWEEAALREVDEETACEAEITSFAGATVYVPRRTPRLVLYWNMSLRRERPFEPNAEVDELVWLTAPGAVARLDHETERRLVERCGARGVTKTEPARSGALAIEVAAVRADVLRRLLAAPEDGSLTGLGPALELLDQAGEALDRAAEPEAAMLVAEARRLGLLALSEPELSLRARALREEARALVPWRRRAIRRMLPRDEPPSPEALHLAAELRDGARRDRALRWIAPALFASSSAALLVALWSVPPAARASSLWGALCGAFAGAAAAAFWAWRGLSARD